MLTATRTKEILSKSGALIEGHFVGTSGDHLSLYIAKDRATRFTSFISELCMGLAEIFAGDNIDAVVAPAVGGIALSQWTAYHLSHIRADRPEVLALYSEHQDEILAEGKSITLSSGRVIGLTEGEELILRKPAFILKRGFNADVRGKRILEIEDVLTTGGSAARTADAIRDAGGILVALGVLANGGNVTAAMCRVNRLEALIFVERRKYSEAECADYGLCAESIPINTEFGHGKSFLARKA